jgi:site-specific DNA recombinase
LNDKATKLIVVDSPKAALIKKAFELYATGTYSYALLAKTLAELGLVGRKKKQASLSPANVQYLLKNPFYCGLIRFKGELYEGRHDAIISKELFDRVQERMTRKCKPNKRKPAYFVFRGLMYCGECGCLITAEKQKGHHYYRCTKRKGNCSQPYVREEALTEQITEHFRRTGLQENHAEWLVGEIEKEKSHALGEENVRGELLTQEIKALDEKIDLLMTGYLAQAISLPEYQAQKNKLMEVKQRLKDELAAARQTNETWFEPAIRFVNDCGTAAKFTTGGDLEEIKGFLQKIGSNFLLRDKRLALTPRDEWEIVSNQRVSGLLPDLSAQRTFGAPSENSDRIPMRKGWDSNPR